MDDKAPAIRKDLEFIPVQQGNQQLILIRDHLGLVREGMGVAPHLFQIMALLDGTKTIRDLQMELMRQRGGVIVGADEVSDLLKKLDDAFMLDSEKFNKAKYQIEAEFNASTVRPCFHCGKSYPDNPAELKKRLDQILTVCPPDPRPNGKIVGLIAPHIDPAAGQDVYASAYQMLKYTAPSRVVLLGVGHQMGNGLFCLTEKNFETPLGLVKNEPALVRGLRKAGKDILTEMDFAHRSEHSIEFQVIFLQHLLGTETFTIVPILCGSFQSGLPEYSRNTFLRKTEPFLCELRRIINEPGYETLLVAGVDFAHIGPKFGHNMPAGYLENQAKTHDNNLLKYLGKLEAERFWEESIRVEDRFNVCGFPAMAAMLEVLPACHGEIINHRYHHERPTQSAVSFAAVVFVAQN
ncbi:MAG: AmmeMemoRadiSam system protein B [Pseudomonadota bacterium]